MVRCDSAEVHTADALFGIWSSHGLVRDVQILRDLAPGLPQRDLFDDLQLAFGESDGALGRRRGAIPAASVISRPPSTKS
jgi:hypothetical protein